MSNYCVSLWQADFFFRLVTFNIAGFYCEVKGQLLTGSIVLT